MLFNIRMGVPEMQAIWIDLYQTEADHRWQSASIVRTWSQPAEASNMVE